jgi:LmbE family N-acetylglucosaminyl deacetylase
MGAGGPLLNFYNGGAEISIPDEASADAALARTSHMAVGAHPDDIPIMAFDGILHCFGREDLWFLGVTVTDGAGSPRAAQYARYTDDQMRAVRMAEEKRAAAIGKYSGTILLDYPSSLARDGSLGTVSAELAGIISAARPEVVYTHNLADSHDTHVAVALRTIKAIRSLPAPDRPDRLYGCEVWRDLDWMSKTDRVVFDVSGGETLADDLLQAYESQVGGGKRYDIAVAGRRAAHATFHTSHEVDGARSVIYGMDLTSLIIDDSIDPGSLVLDHVSMLRSDVADRIERLN